MQQDDVVGIGVAHYVILQVLTLWQAFGNSRSDYENDYGTHLGFSGERILQTRHNPVVLRRQPQQRAGRFASSVDVMGCRACAQALHL